VLNEIQEKEKIMDKRTHVLALLAAEKRVLLRTFITSGVRTFWRQVRSACQEIYSEKPIALR